MVTNHTRSLNVSLPSDREIRMTREFDAPRALVFDAFSKCEHIRNWLRPKGMSMPICEMDFRPGGSWRFVHADDQGHEFAFRGQIREVTPPERMVRTFEFEGLPGHVSVETLVLEEVDGRTRMTVTSAFDSVEDRDGMLQSGMESGASESYDHLDEYLGTLA